MKLRLIVAIAVVALLAAVGGAFAGHQGSQVPTGGTFQIGHKPGHAEPPSCPKFGPYGKHPKVKKNCPSNGGSSVAKKGKGK
jgi:hypothetical protein